MRREVVGAVRNTLLAGLTLFVAGCAGTVRAPYPPIQADTSPAALARGATIFHASCEACHRNGGAETVSGAPLRELPSYMGSFYAANLTSHPTAGVGSATDEELARAIRYAVSRDGRLMVMPSYAMGDADLAAVLGFMRSGDPLFAADAQPAPRSEFSFFGGLGFRVITGNEPVERPASGIPVPAKAATLEYGRYMAHDVYDCASCHTDGFSPNKTEGDDVFSGGMSFLDPEGNKVRSSNITFHETGLANWTLEDFTRAVRDGLAPDGSALRSPMPRFRGMDTVEAQALYDFLRSVPEQDNEVKGARPRLTATSVRPAWVAESAETSGGADANTASSVAEAAALSRSEDSASASSGTAASPPATGAGGATAAGGSATSGVAPSKGGGTVTTAPLASSTAPAPQRKPHASEPKVDAAKLFVQLGCASCHGPGARYHDRLAQASGKSDADLVRWVRNPEQFLPGTPMPTYADLIDERTARALVRWVKAGGPASLPSSR
ncbi:c-type cytochrome [Pyxidicoccus sp. MSG2]|uniref:c-type cytochrome n=1 Tax=Pyxidicoccus sp. MSG2 TaxID=2996790 RepID=UPI00226EDBD1|nr:cytochrome c [Pyxidicoccus sp. MSG2]MCY1016223.1 cytochrome c [Pyxidicoccus sp. MSG2]